MHDSLNPSLSSQPLAAVEAAAPADALSRESLVPALRELAKPLFAVRQGGRVHLTARAPDSFASLAGVVPAVLPESLGAESFRRTHGVRCAYVTGAMAGGIASVDLVVAMGRAGMLGFFGSGGLPPKAVEEAILAIKQQLSADEPYGFNLLHNHYEPQMEMAAVELYLRHGVRRVEAAAFMRITPAIALYRAKGLRELPDGRVSASNHVFAKVSRPEVVAQFLGPAPEAVLRELVAAGKLTELEAKLAAQVPLAEDVTAEADSGGHTDQRPLSVLIPLMLRERDLAMEKYGWAAKGISIRVGAAGGIGEPQAALAALALGADYLVTGSLNQSCVQAGTSELVKKMLCEADMADVATAPSPDMFEVGAKVQVLRRATLFPQRAQRLAEVYKAYPGFEAIPAVEREKIEKQILRRPFAEIWAETESYWATRDPAQAEKGRSDPKYRMSLCFRWYLGLSSRWARLGDAGRQADFQIWCGPAIGAFNRWVKGSWLEAPAQRDAALAAEALLRATAALSRREAAARAGVAELPSPTELARPAAREELPQRLV